MDVVKEDIKLGQCDRKGCRGQGNVEADDSLWRALKGKARP